MAKGDLRMSIILGANAPSRKKFPLTSHPEFVKKFPAIQEALAMKLGQDGDLMSLAMRNLCLEALYQGVCNLVYKQAVRYSPTCPHLDVEDMVQECWHRIIRKLHLYKQEKAKFTTWVVKVAISVLSKLYHKGRKLADRYTEITEGEHDRCGDEKATERVWQRDFKEAIKLLQAENPDKAHIVHSLFYDKEGDLRNKIVFKITGEECGISAQKVSDFYHQVVKLFFYRTFEGEYCNE
jgi:RNA polymerase sigma factor (sigma-70 family)